MSSLSSLPMDPYPTEPPPPSPRSGPGRPGKRRRPALANYDPLIHLLLSTPHVWHVVDVIEPDQGASAVYLALYRRGFDVTVRLLDGEKVVWARWSHPVPEWVVVSTVDPDRQIKLDPSEQPWTQLSMFEDES